MTTVKIEALTDEQERLLDTYGHEWGSTSRARVAAHCPLAEDAIRKMYLLGGYVPPERFFWFGSPSEMLFVAITHDGASDMFLSNGIFDNPFDLVFRRLKLCVSGQLYKHIFDRLGKIIHNYSLPCAQDLIKKNVLRRAIEHDNAKRIMEDEIEGLYRRGILSESIDDRVSNFFRHTVATYSVGIAAICYFRDVLGLRLETSGIDGVEAVIRACGWVLPMEKACYVSERPSKIADD